MRRLGLALLLVALLGAACDGPDSGSTTTSLGVTTTAVPDSTTTVAPTTSTALPSTTEPPSLTIHLTSSRLYSPDEKVWISGWVDRLGVEVFVNGVMAATGEHGEASTGFDYEAVLEPGDHEVEVMAVDSSGNQTIESLQLIVDPDLEKELAFIQELDRMAKTLVADYIQMLTGEDAVAAAREDGFIGPDDELGNDFYIRNQNPRLRTLSLADDLVVVLTACYPDEGPCVTLESVDDATWYRLASDPESAVKTLGWHWYGLGELPYWLTLQDGAIVQVEEQYLP